MRTFLDYPTIVAEALRFRAEERWSAVRKPFGCYEDVGGKDEDCLWFSELVRVGGRASEEGSSLLPREQGKGVRG